MTVHDALPADCRPAPADDAPFAPNDGAAPPVPPAQ